MYNELVDKIKEPSTLILIDFRISKYMTPDFSISKYMTTRLLKGTELSTIQKAKREVIVDTDDIKDSNHAGVTGKI